MIKISSWFNDKRWFECHWLWVCIWGIIDCVSKIWNGDYFEIFTTLWAWQKQYRNPIQLLHWDYFNHISAIYVPNFAHISPIYHLYIIKIKSIFQSFEFGKYLKIQTPPPSSQNSLHFELWTFWFSALTPPPPYGLFPNFGTFLIMTAPLTVALS